MRVYSRSFFFILFIISGIRASGQAGKTAVIDSLLSELPKHKHDTFRALILDKLSFAYSNVAPDEGIKYANELYQLSRELKWQMGIARANAVLGINYAAKSDYKKAIVYYNEALKISRSLGDSSKAAGTIANISLVYLSQGNYPKALAAAFEALRIYEAIGDVKNEAIIKENIGTIYYDQKEYEKAMPYYTDALQGYKRINDKESIARCYGNIGSILGATNQLDKALQNHLAALETNKQSGNKYSIQINLANIGVIHYRMEEHGAALDDYFAALKISDEMGDKHSSAINLGNIGEAYLAIANSTKEFKGAYVLSTKSANLKSAINYLQRSTSLCRELNFSGPYIEFSGALSDAYTSAGDDKKALAVFKDHIHLKDSLFTLQSKLEITELEMKRKEELKNKDVLISKNQKDISRLKALEQRSKMLVYLACALAISLLILFILKSLFAYRRSNRLLIGEKERHLKHIKTQKELLEEIAHIQAHEVSGPVATILGLVEVFNYEDPSDPANQTIIKGITDVTHVLDEKVKDVIRKKNTMTDM
jgi:tetratricopeptide (TPR) repeat protein